MHVRTIRSLLWLATAVAGGVAIACCAAVCIIPPRVDLATRRTLSAHGSAVDVARSFEVTPADLRNVEQVNLRRVLHDPPPPPPAAPPEVMTPPLDIHLTGTIFEPGHCRAMIVLPDGTTQLKAVGDSAGNARILRIDDGHITVQYAGHAVLLNVERKKD